MTCPASRRSAMACSIEPPFARSRRRPCAARLHGRHGHDRPRATAWARSGRRTDAGEGSGAHDRHRPRRRGPLPARRALGSDPRLPRVRGDQAVSPAATLRGESSGSRDKTAHTGRSLRTTAGAVGTAPGSTTILQPLSRSTSSSTRRGRTGAEDDLHAALLALDGLSSPAPPSDERPLRPLQGPSRRDRLSCLRPRPAAAARRTPGPAAAATPTRHARHRGEGRPRWVGRAAAPSGSGPDNAVSQAGGGRALPVPLRAPAARRAR